MATTAYGKTGGTLAPIEIGNKPYGGGVPIRKPLNTHKTASEDNGGTGFSIKGTAKARMARGGSPYANKDNRRLRGLKGSYRP